ncbi:MAG: DUF3592 domain-containing protein [Pseudomonadota bacterium]
MGILGKIAGGFGQGQRLQGKIVLAIVAFVLLSKGFDGLQKAAQVRLSGNAVSGEVVQHLTECTVRLRESGRWDRFDVPCKSIHSLRQRYGFSNVRSYRKRLVMVRFVREDGHVHFAKVRPSRKFIRWRTPVGTKVDIVYNTSNPDRIKPQPAWNAVQGDLLFFLGGIGMLGFLFWSMVGPLLLWFAQLFAGSGARQQREQHSSKPNEIIEALQKMADGLGKSSGKAKERSSRSDRQAARQMRREEMAERVEPDNYQAKTVALESGRATVKRMYLRPRNWRKRPIGNPGKYEPGSWFGFAR